jgi:hypothetical protein
MQKASELSGVPYDLVRQWESRRKRRAIKQANLITSNAGVTVSHTPTITIAADKLETEIQENGRETKLSLSRAAKRMAKDSESATLRHAPFVKAAAQTAAIVNPELYASKDKDQAQVAVNIAILGS